MGPAIDVSNALKGLGDALAAPMGAKPGPPVTMTREDFMKKCQTFDPELLWCAENDPKAESKRCRELLERAKRQLETRQP